MEVLEIDVPLKVDPSNVIEIDDSGWGSLIGGITIGFYKKDTNDMEVEYIPVKYFQGGMFKKRRYLSECYILIMETLKKWGVTPETHKLAICQGWIFDGPVEWLEDKGWSVDRVQIKGKLQVFVEKMFKRELYKTMNFDSKRRTAGQNAFFKALEWVGESLSTRERFVKTGWKSWEKKWKPRAKLAAHHQKTE